MAQEANSNDKTKELKGFISEYNLESIASKLYDEGVSINDLCSKTDEEIDGLSKKLSQDKNEQNLFKQAVSDTKSKISNEEKVDDEEEADQIFIKTLAGNCISIDITQDLTIKDLKETIESKEGYAPKTQKLMYDGKTLQDDKTIQEYNIGKDSQIHLAFTKSKDGCCIL